MNKGKFNLKRLFLIIIIIFVFFIVLANMTSTKSNDTSQQQTNYKKTGSNIPTVNGYETPVKIMSQDDFIMLSYSPKGILSSQISSASADVMKRKNPNEPYDYSSFNEYFALDNSEITIDGAVGRMGYQDHRTYKGVTMSQKYETIQIEVSKGDFHYSVQLGHSPNNVHDAELYKNEAIKIIKALLVTYK